jgi:hypothetical protein
LQRLISWTAEILSCLKTLAFRTFQISQHPSARKAENLSTGKPGGGVTDLRFWSWTPIIELRFRRAKKLTAIAQPPMICSGVSSLALHTWQIESCTICFLRSRDLLWILPWTRSHMNNCTRGGAEFFQTKLAPRSLRCPLDLRSLYRAPVSRPTSPLLKTEIRLSVESSRCTPPRSCCTRCNWDVALAVSLGTNEFCRPMLNIWATVQSFSLQWLYSAGHKSSSDSSWNQTSCQKEQVVPFPIWTVVIAWYSGRIYRRVFQWSPCRSPFRFATEALPCTHWAQAENCGKWSLCSSLIRRHRFWVPRSVTPKPPESFG